MFKKIIFKKAFDFWVLYRTFVNTINKPKYPTMTEREYRIRLVALFDQLHYTVIYEDELIKNRPKRELYELRDSILDEIIHIRNLGISR